MNDRSYFRLLLKLSTMAGVILLLQWLLYPMAEYEALKRRSSAVDRKIDTYYVEGRSVVNNEHPLNSTADLLDISLIVPAFNEEKRLPIMLDDSLSFLESWCREQYLSYEVLIVDDASTDNTAKVALEYTKQNKDVIRVLKLGENHGKGGAVKLGVEKARGNYILMVDADGATDIRDLAGLYLELRKVQIRSSLDGSYMGVALGSRAHLEEKSIATRAFYRTILMRGFHVLVTLFCTRNIKDTQCGFKLFTRKAANILFKSLHLERWAFDIELIYLAESLKIPLTEVAVRWHEVDGSKLIQTKSDVVITSLTMARDIIFVKAAYSIGLWNLEP